MRIKAIGGLLAAMAFIALDFVRAGVAFPDPVGGWTYKFEGDKREPGAGTDFDALDGTWSHNNGSDVWDGSEIGGALKTDGGYLLSNAPGGVSAITENGTTFLRIQDTGDPRNYGFTDPSNRKIYLGHSITGDGGAEAQMDEGITLSFRARIPTKAKATGPIDDWYRQNLQAGGVKPYPDEGDGYVTSDGGKGNFVIAQASGGAIAFSLTTAKDTTGGDLTPTANFSGLTMNEFNGNAVSPNVNFGQGSATNVVALDPTDWHEFWIVLRKDPAAVGTHQAYIYVDGNATPMVFKMTAGNGNDYAGITYLAMGMTATPQNAALDVDFVAYKLGASFPPSFAPPTGGWTYKFEGDKREPGGGTDFDALDGTWSHNNGSDAWDGSEVGGILKVDGGYLASNAPGGVSALTESGTTFLRIQDTGDPRNYGFTDPSNRKVYLGHSITGDGGSESQMDEGITLSFRARIPTKAKASGPIDDWYRQNQQAGGVKPYPDEGDGYVTSDGGKGNFVIAQASGGAIAFSLTTKNDTTGGDLTPTANFSGLTMNEFNGNAVSANVNFGQGSATNVVTLDPTDWHVFWIVLRKDPANVGTHQAFVYVDGNLTPTVFKMTAGNGNDYSGLTYLAMGMTATPQNAALDIDFVAYKLGAVFPGGALDNLPPEVFNVSPVIGTAFVNAADGIVADATTQGANSISASGIKLVLNGQDVSSAVELTGTAQARKIAYRGLVADTIYRGSLIVSDQDGRAATNRFFFDTFTDSKAKVIEAEDYNHDAGQFSENPAVGEYSGYAGTDGIDFRETSPASLGAYRTSDPVDTAVSGDLARPGHVAAGTSDYVVGLIRRGEWLNYTRTFAAGNYQLFLRCSSTAAQNILLEKVTGDPTRPNQAVQLMGGFSVPRTGNLAVFDYAPFADIDGKPVTVALSGKTTLRLRASSASDDVALNYILAVPVAGGLPAIASVIGFPNRDAAGVQADAPVEVLIVDGATPVEPSSVKLTVDGAVVAPSVEKAGGITRAVYSPAGLWAPGSTHAVEVNFIDGGSRTVSWSFSTGTYLVLTPGMKVADANTRGFVWRTFQNEANTEALTQRAEDALAGKLKDAGGELLQNLADPSVQGPASNPGTPSAPGTGVVTFRIPTVINVSQVEGSNFGTFTPDEQMPGIPGLTGASDGIAVEIQTFLQLPRGVSTMIVNSDDGFKTTAGYLNDTPLILAEVGFGRGSADTIFEFAVEEAGTYAFRTLYFESGGDASIEWAVINPDGTRALVNDTEAGAPAAFQTGTIPSRPPDNVAVTIASLGNGSIRLSWPSGTLQSAEDIGGPFAAVPGATSPHTVTTDAGRRFYRVLVR